MTVYILFFIFHVIIYGPRVCNKHLNNNVPYVRKKMQSQILQSSFAIGCFKKVINIYCNCIHMFAVYNIFPKMFKQFLNIFLT